MSTRIRTFWNRMSCQNLSLHFKAWNFFKSLNPNYDKMKLTVEFDYFRWYLFVCLLSTMKKNRIGTRFNLQSFLSLRFRNFFNKDPGYWIPSSVPISVPISGAISDRESHANLSVEYVITVSLNMADAMKIFISTCPHVDNSVNGQRTRTLCAIESEVPTFAAGIAVVNSQCTRPVNTKGSIRKVLGKNTFLSNMGTQEKLLRVSITSYFLGSNCVLTVLFLSVLSSLYDLA